MTKLKGSQILSLTLMLFAIFFGAGNMIFPPAMGQQAGEKFYIRFIRIFVNRCRNCFIRYNRDCICRKYNG